MNPSDDPQRSSVGNPVLRARGEDLRNTRSHALKQLLFGEGDGSGAAYALLDGASVRGLVRAIETHGAPALSLLKGKQDLSMQRVAPRLVSLEADSPFLDWLLAKGWGRHWGVLLRSSAERLVLHRHLRELMTAEGPDGQLVWFRYYDPRVLRTYLPTCTREESRQFFGPVQIILAEDASGANALECRPGPAGAELLEHGLQGE